MPVVAAVNPPPDVTGNLAKPVEIVFNDGLGNTLTKRGILVPVDALNVSVGASVILKANVISVCPYFGGTIGLA